MAARMPSFYWLHAGRAALDAGITMSPAASATWPKYRSIDGFPQRLTKHASSGANSYWQVNRGAAGLEAVDTLFVPSGHNLGAQTVTVKSSTTGSYGGEETTRLSFTSAAGLIQQTATSTTDRWLRVGFAGTGTWEYGEVWLSRKRTPTSAVVVDPAWDNTPKVNVSVQDFPSGTRGTVVLGGDQKTLKMTFGWVEGADYTLFDDLSAACNRGKAPLWVDAPDSDIATALYWLEEIEERKQDSPNPAGTGPTYSIKMSLTETIG